MIAAIVIDIEGTTSPTDSVREKLYDYTRRHLSRWLTDNLGGAADPVIAQTRELSGQCEAGPSEVAEILCGWLDSDVKAEPLKIAQGLVCAEGFRNDELRGEFFDDVPSALVAWRADGIGLYVYSSGSVRNQQDWFTYARGEELSSLIRPAGQWSGSSDPASRIRPAHRIVGSARSASSPCDRAQPRSRSPRHATHRLPVVG